MVCAMFQVDSVKERLGGVNVTSALKKCSKA